MLDTPTKADRFWQRVARLGATDDDTARYLRRKALVIV